MFHSRNCLLHLIGPLFLPLLQKLFGKVLIPNAVFRELTSNAAFAVYWVASTVIMWIQSVLITKYLEKQDEKKAQTVTGEGSIK